MEQEQERLLTPKLAIKCLDSMGVCKTESTLASYRTREIGPKYRKIGGGKIGGGSVYYKKSDLEDWVSSGIVTPKNNKQRSNK